MPQTPDIPTPAISRRRVLGGLGICGALLSAPAVTLPLLPTPAQAAPVPYALDRARSVVAFDIGDSSQPIKGRMPIQSADIRLDLDRLDRSTASVTMNAAAATCSFAFATQTMRGPTVLDTDRFPTIAFTSTGFQGDILGGVVSGRLTIRGITQAQTLRAEIFRQRGTEGRDALTVRMRGALDRHAFGASGMAALVGPSLAVDIIARISRT